MRDRKRFLGCHLKDFFAIAVHIEQREFAVEVGVGFLGVILADQGVGTDLHLVVVIHLLLVALVECRAGQADKNNNDAKVDKVAAIASGVAPA